jgi:hypothetical protein
VISRDPSYKRASIVSVTIDPEPLEQDRKAILAALAGEEDELGGWSQAALAEGVEDAELDP